MKCPECHEYNECKYCGNPLVEEATTGLYGLEFDELYKEYREELAGISYMSTGLTVNVIKYENDCKDAMRRLIAKLIKKVV